MEGNSNQQPKEVTLNDLAAQMASGFERIDKEFKVSREHTKKLIDDKIDELARITQGNFLSVEGRLDGVEGRLGRIETGMEDIKANLNKKVDVVIHNELVYRVEKTEEKLGLKPKLKFA
jgi:hypothetical protein